MFDSEPFDYLFNMSTGIMDSKILYQDYDNLTSVLELLHKKDDDALRIILFCYEAHKYPENLMPELELDTSESRFIDQSL